MSRFTELPYRKKIPFSFISFVLILVVMQLRLLVFPFDLKLEHYLGFSIAVILLGLVCCLGLGKPLLAGSMIALLFLSFFLADAHLKRSRRAVLYMGATSISRLEFEVVSGPNLGSYGQNYKVQVVTPGDAYGSKLQMTTDRMMSLHTRFSCPGRFSTYEGRPYEQKLLAQGLVGKLKPCGEILNLEHSSILSWSGQLQKELIEKINPDTSDARALMAACTCGYKKSIQQMGVADACSRAGVAHIVCVSGLHLIMLATLLETLILALPVSMRVRYLIVIGASLLFVIVCGSPISSLRALLMFCITRLGHIRGRRADALSSIGIVGCIFLLLDASIAVSLGFLLSAFAVVGLWLFSAYATYFLEVLIPSLSYSRFLGRRLWRHLDGLSHKAKAGLAGSCVAICACAPFTFQAFSQLSLIAPITNILVIPFITPYLGLCMVWLFISPFEGLSNLFLLVLDGLGGIILKIIYVLSSLSISCTNIDHPQAMSVVAVGLLVGLYLWWPKVSARFVRMGCGAALFFITAFFVRWNYFAPARIVVLDVGQGDAILVQHKASRILIDAGPKNSLSDALLRNHVKSLDGVFVSHMHADHYQGLSDLPGYVKVDCVYVPNGSAEFLPDSLIGATYELCHDIPQNFSYNNTCQVGDFKLTMIWPWEPVSATVNEESMQLILEYSPEDKHMTGLFTGDCEKDEMQAIIEANDVGKIDFLKVGHHGSEISLTKSQAEVLSPTLAIASCGKNNKYGHPSQVCQEILETQGCRFMATKDWGDIEVRPSRYGLQVRVSCFAKIDPD